MAMTPGYRRVAYTLLAIAAIMSAVQYAQILSTTGVAGVRDGLGAQFKAWWTQQRVQFTLRVVDQYGEPAPDFHFKVQLVCIRPYVFLFPMSATARHIYDVKTDANGIMTFHTYWRRASEVKFVEDNKHSQYVLRQWTDHEKSWNGDPVANAFEGGVRPSPLRNSEKALSLIVLRHGPIVQHKWIRLEKTLTGPEGVVGKDKDLFTLSVHLAEERIDLGDTPGDFTIEIKGGLLAYEHWRQRFTKRDDKTVWENWGVTLRAAPGVGILGAPFDLITEAPEKGYWHTVLYDMPVSIKPLKDYRAPVPGVIDFPAAVVKDGQALYRCDFEPPGLSANLFVSTQSPKRYYLLQLIHHVLIDCA
jgi:hypothetical protein